MFTANLTASSTNTGDTSVNFTSSSTASGWTLTGTSAGITILPGAGSLSGYVYIDANGNGKYDVNEGLPGVTITLSGSAQGTVTTNDDGYYQFANLQAGVYAVTETQPAACIDGPTKAGTIDGATVGTAHNPGNSIDGIALPAAKSGVNYQFTESNLNPLFIPNRLLATSTQPVGSAAWRETIRNTMTRAEQQRSHAKVAPAAVAKHTGSALVAASTKVAPAAVAKHAAGVSAAASRPVKTKQPRRIRAAASAPVHVSPSQPPTAKASPSVAAKAPLTSDELKPIVNEAIAEWAKAGLPAASLAVLRNVTVSIADLAGSNLGWTENGQVFIDRDAAGYGWFVDATPGVSEEFVATSNNGQLQAVDPRALDRMDLLTVVEHELGHVAGLGDLDPSLYDLMSSSLNAGIRREASTSDVDAVFARYSSVN